MSYGSDNRANLVLDGATLALGLVAGLFYAFAVAMLPGLHASADSTLVDAMQNINKAIENPAFFATFIGGPVLAIWALVAERRDGCLDVVRWVLAGIVLYAVCLILTFGFSIALNDALERAGDTAGIADVAKVRDDYDTPWVVWHVVRTLASIGAFACLVRAMYIRGRRGSRVTAAQR